NRYVLLRGVSIHESENEIKEILADYGYQVQEVKRFHKMPIVKVMLSKIEDWIFNGESDQNKSSPKSHFNQYRKCYTLNHIARECPKKRKVCKYCGLANHEAAKCRNKNDTRKHKCVLCRGQHPSDSVQKKKAYKTVPIKSNAQQQANDYSYTDAAKGQRSNGNENKNGPQKPKKKRNKSRNEINTANNNMQADL
ncbi:hypothetical protein RFI_38841, partial [Reticulomyxa filosa]